MLHQTTRLLVAITVLGCAVQPSPRPGPTAEPEASTFLAPNATRTDGTPIYIHVSESDMPWRIAVGVPPDSPRYGSRAQARDAAVEAMRMWEQAIQPHVAWFQLQFVEEDASAPVQIQWKRRVVGDAAGRAGVTYELVEERLRVGGQMTISTRPDPHAAPLTVDEVRLLVAHEFGHVLGLMHCLDCDSAMNYSWHTRDRIFVTESDVRTFLDLLRQPNGSSLDPKDVKEQTRD